ncbi:MAG: sugar transferase [Pirellulaceae bacterium]|nr:sugar transferase [Pirellulaceae bacterium]
MDSKSPAVVSPKKRANSLPSSRIALPGKELYQDLPSHTTAQVLPEAIPRRSAMLKRTFDIGLSLIILSVTAVPMLLISFAIKLTSRGPVIYSQQRVGKNGTLFFIYKFRSMRQDAEEASGPVWSSKNDSRQTFIGGFLRRTSLDELPQLWNVLRGEMSLIGPRPERPFFVKQFSKQFPAYHQRHQVLPGLTGLAQIRGCRGNTSIEKRLEQDIAYVKNWSFKLDFYIFLKTPWEVFLAKNAH